MNVYAAYVQIFCCLLFARFAHFFASPLLLDSSLDREIEAVDSGENTRPLPCSQLDSLYRDLAITLAPAVD